MSTTSALELLLFIGAILLAIYGMLAIAPAVTGIF